MLLLGGCLILQSCVCACEVMAEEADGDDGWKGALRRDDVRGAENEATVSGYETAKDKAVMAANEEDAGIAMSTPV